MQFTPVDHIKDAKSRRKARQAFYTPLALVDTMVDYIGGWDGMRTLEPSSGDGRIVHTMLAKGWAVDACEIDDAMRERCRSMGANIVGADFFAYSPSEPYNAIVMNPPFQRDQWKRHIEHAYTMLSKRGRILAIAPDSAREAFAKCEVNLPGAWASYELLDADTFKESGAGVSTILIEIRRASEGEHQGFSNYATWNAWAAITSDQAMYTTSARITSADYPKAFAQKLADMGCSMYGVDWLEIYNARVEQLANA